MNIMGSIKKIKKRFKDAKEVRSVNGYIFDYTKSKNIHECSGHIYINDENGDNRTLLYNRIKKKEYAEIISYKEPLYQLTAKEVVHAYENPQWLKDTFKEFFETELEVNLWYKSDYPLLLFITEVRHHELVGYGFNAKEEYKEGTFCTRADVRNKVDCDNFNFRPATEKEVEEALVKEARKRYKVGDNIFKDNKIHSITEDLFLSLVWFVGCNTLEGGANGLNDNTVLFNNGTWAEII